MINIFGSKPLILYLLSLYFITKPFYMLPSGLPQLADGIMVSIIIIYLFKYNIKLNKVVFISFMLLMYILIINSVWGIIFSSPNFLMSVMFYVLNIMTLLIIINLYWTYGTIVLKFIFYGVVCSITIQLVCSLFYSNSLSARETLFFNNPNQLGYYALLSLGALYLLDTILKINYFYLVIYSIGCIYLALLSLSNAAILSALLMMFFYFFIKIFHEKSIKYLFILFLSGLILITGFNFLGDTISSTHLYESVTNRIFSDKYDIESNFEERRYDRIMDYPQYLIFGAGEGLNQYRFGRGEIHSTIFGFLFSYGIIGSLILCIFVISIISKAKLLYYVPLLSILLYGLTHNGIRQGFFWIILGLIFAVSNKPKKMNGDIDEENKLLLREG